MHHVSTRRAIIVLALFALLFSVDAAFDAAVAPSLIMAIVACAGALAWVLIGLSERVLTGPPESRLRAVVLLNVIGAAPVLVALRYIDRAEAAGMAGATLRGTLAWLVAVVLWTTGVLVGASRKERAAHDPTRRGRGLVPLYRASARHRAA